MFKKFSSLLSRQQEGLLTKLIHRDSMDVDPAGERDCLLMQWLYEYFFDWQQHPRLALGGDRVAVNPRVPLDREPEGAAEAAPASEQQSEGQTAEDEKRDRRKREEFEREQDLLLFAERGGFSRVLKDIFNPSDMAAMELDSVYQLKNICKDFYRKKQLMSSALIDTLDALSNERPAVL